MILHHIALHNFKNIARAELEFSAKVNSLLGDNGMGKSNLLDAIYYLSFCKSFAGVTDSTLIRRGENFAMLEGHYTRRGTEEVISAGMETASRRRSFRRGGKEYRRLSEHIGLLPLVMVSPRDMYLINGTGEERRRFIDMVISQSDTSYLDRLIRYDKALRQRNIMLREGQTDASLFDAVEMTMSVAGYEIALRRSDRISSLSKIFARYYRDIAPDEDSVDLTYAPSVDCADGNPDTLARVLRDNRGRDSIIRHTTAGPHRDDMEMSLNMLPVRRLASQGQAKTYSIALRLAQYEFLSESTSMKPLLLLDDIFDKLDAHRVSHIMQIVSRESFGQIFITDTNRKHLDTIVSDIPAADSRLFAVENGVFSLLDNSNKP